MIVERKSDARSLPNWFRKSKEKNDYGTFTEVVHC